MSTSPIPLVSGANRVSINQHSTLGGMGGVASILFVSSEPFCLLLEHTVLIKSKVTPRRSK